MADRTLTPPDIDTGAQAAGLPERAAQWWQSRPALFALVLGIVTACGFPPLHLWWVALPALALFVLHIHAAPDWRAATWRGWLFGWAHLTLANNWIATAFTHQAKMPEFLGWIAVPLLCIYLAIYPALAAMAARQLARRAGLLAFGAIFAACWIVAEWLRSWVFTGYPWPPMGLVLLGGWETPGIARILPWMGTYALSGIAVLIASVLAWLTLSRRYVSTGAFAGVILAAMLLPPFGSAPAPERPIRYTLVQPFVPQSEINDGAKWEEHFQRAARLSNSGTAADGETPRVVLWPESAVPDYIEDGYPQRYYDARTVRDPETGVADPAYARRRLAAVMGPRSTLLTGTVNLDIGLRGDGTPGAISARNAVVAIDAAGDITQQYAKAHLVPYGEYLPLPWLLERIGLARLTSGVIPYDPGEGAATMDLGEYGRVGVQVCYEIVFSGQVVDRDDRPQYLFNPSNDGWFGAWGPPQHLAQARMRAIEEGLPVMRSTTTGISAVIDADGVVRQSIPMGKAGAVQGTIPSAKSPRLFSQLGNMLALIWAGFWLILAFTSPRLLALRAERS